MKVCSLASGSKGNCTYIETQNTKILLDVGVNLKYLIGALQKLEVEPNEINAVIVTHEHSDHIKGLEPFCRKFDVPVFCAPSLYNLLSAQMPNISNLINPFKSNFEIGEFKIFPFELSHDSTSCFGYRIFDEMGSVSFVTDTGIVTNDTLRMIEKSSMVFLESNYDPDMLFACSYPIFLKKRILGNKGHLSNLDCAKIIVDLCKSGTRQVVLSHISENSNTPYLAYNTVKNYLEEQGVIIGTNINIGINYQNKINTIYKINKK